LTANNTKISGDVDLNDGFSANGVVSLVGAAIGQDLNCSQGIFMSDFTAKKVNIGGDAFLSGGLSSAGKVDLSGAIIGGDLNCVGGQFDNQGTNTYAFLAEGIKVARCIFFCNGFKANGRVSIMSATIGGDLDCEGGQFINQDTNTRALDAERVKIDGDVFLRKGFKAVGKVDFESSYIARSFEWYDVKSPEDAIINLSSANVGSFRDDPMSWPFTNNLFLDGFSYDKIYNLTNLDIRLAWLRHQPTNQFFPQTYEQLASVLKKNGQEGEAVSVLIAKNEDFASFLRWYSPSRLWYNGFGWLIGYGYKTWQAIVPSLLFIFFGAMLFSFGHRHNLILPSDEDAYSFDTKGKLQFKKKYEDYPLFNPFIYSLEVFVPLVNLGIDEFWRPAANRDFKFKFGRKTRTISGSVLRLYWWLHIMSGWVLTTLWVAGLTGLAKT
jgi:hypothetical protein